MASGSLGPSESSPSTSFTLFSLRQVGAAYDTTATGLQAPRFANSRIATTGSGTTQIYIEDGLANPISGTTSSGLVNEGQIVTFVGVFVGGSAPKLYINGILAATATSNWDGTTYAGLYSFGGNAASLAYFGGVILRAWTLDEIQSFASDPMQLIERKRQVSYFTVATAPTLSAATVTSITSSGATPRVTLTF